LNTSKNIGILGDLNLGYNNKIGMCLLGRQIGER
jgi:hypothetical protein